MTSQTSVPTSDWITAFPLRPAADAVEAVCESWQILTCKPRPGFNSKMREPRLTRVLKSHVENVTARQRGLLGMWATEGIINTIDPETAEITEERRTDIVYGWNDAAWGIQLVFEFKKLNRHKKTHNQYLGKDGLARFVTGIYSRGQPVAVMVGILLDSFDEVVPTLRTTLGEAATSATLRLCHRPNGKIIDRPSLLFSAADFDTEHSRPMDLAPEHGTIRVAHLFLSFC